LYSTYLGGSDIDNGIGIAVDSAGNAYVTGNTYSTDFPTMNPLQPANGAGGGGFTAFVAKITPPPVILVPPNLNFGSQTVGVASSPQVSTLTNASSPCLKSYLSESVPA